MCEAHEWQVNETREAALSEALESLYEGANVISTVTLSSASQAVT